MLSKLNRNKELTAVLSAFVVFVANEIAGIDLTPSTIASLFVVSTVLVTTYGIEGFLETVRTTASKTFQTASASRRFWVFVAYIVAMIAGDALDFAILDRQVEFIGTYMTVAQAMAITAAAAISGIALEDLGEAWPVTVLEFDANDIVQGVYIGSDDTPTFG